MRFPVPTWFLTALLMVLLPASASPARLATLIEGRLTASPPTPLHQSGLLKSLYPAREHRAIWLPEGRPGAALEALPAAIRAARDEGLNPEHYHLPRLERLLEQVEDADGDPELLTELELLATDAFLTLASHFADGAVDPTQIESSWYIERGTAHLLPLLDRGAEAGLEHLPRLLPAQAGYHRLREQLAVERSHLADWTAVPVDTPLRAGDRGPAVVALRRRLAELGDLDPGLTDQDTFDAEVTAAVRAFQERHTLGADGIVGPRTFAALNVPPEARITQLKVNLERWRWLPDDLGAQHILVNVANFQLSVHAGDDEVMRQGVVVGRPYRRTPVLSDRIRYLVFNPSWDVPDRLAVQDQLPLIQGNPSYLEQMGFTVLSGWGADAREVNPAEIDWQALGPKRFPYRLRQRPGPLNAMGRVKFMFPNPHNVYLHDTPDRGLFAQPERAASSGCIRLSDAMALARWLLHGPQRPAVMAPERIDAILESGSETTVRLSAPVPIHLLYWTAWVEPDGRVHYTRDIYKRDDRVWDALQRLSPPRPDPEIRPQRVLPLCEPGTCACY